MDGLKENYRELVERIKKNYQNATKEKLKNEDIADRLGYSRSYFSTLTGTRGDVKDYHIADLKKEFSNEINNNVETLAKKPVSYLDKRRELKMNPKFETIPIIDIDIAAANSKEMELYDDKTPETNDFYYIPEFSGCRAFSVYSDSMEPLISKGAKIFAKKIEDWQDYLEFGQVYSIGMTDGRRFLKYIKKGSTPDRLLLRSENQNYDDFEIPISKIRSVWIIDGWMNKHTQSTFFVLNQNKKNTTN